MSFNYLILLLDFNDKQEQRRGVDFFNLHESNICFTYGILLNFCLMRKCIQNLPKPLIIVHPVRFDPHLPALSCSFTSWKRIVATRGHVWVCPAGPYTTSTTAPLQTCGCIVPTAATSTTMASRHWHWAVLRRATSSPASWTWRPVPSHLARTERCEFNAIDTQLLLLVSLDTLTASVVPTGTKVGFRGCGRHRAVSVCDVL